jgi:hypothetical protein
MGVCVYVLEVCALRGKYPTCVYICVYVFVCMHVICVRIRAWSQRLMSFWSWADSEFYVENVLHMCACTYASLDVFVYVQMCVCVCVVCVRMRTCIT